MHARWAGCLLLVITSVTAGAAPATDDGKVRLVEDHTTGRVMSVTATLNIRGRLLTPVGTRQVVPLPLEGTAELKWHERQLAPTGEFHLGLRAVRRFLTAHSRVRVDRQTTSQALRPGRRTIVSEGTVEGLRHYALDGALTNSERELLELPADPLGLAALLPAGRVSRDHSWKAGTWAIPLVTGLDAVNQCLFQGRILSVSPRGTEVQVEGTAEGAVDGAATKVSLNGTLLFDHTAGFLRRANIVQEEHRQAGPISPGLEVVARVRIERTPVRKPVVLTKALAEKCPAKPAPLQLRLLLPAAGNTRLFHDRRWHLFHETPDVSILRRLENGRLVAQCNISPVASAAPGRSTPRGEFVRDVRRTLGDRLNQVQKIETIPANSTGGTLRVTASGVDHGLAMTWFYYLCTAPTGQQVSLVFAVEQRLLKAWGSRDRDIVSTLVFPKRPPRTAGK